MVRGRDQSRLPEGLLQHLRKGLEDLRRVQPAGAHLLGHTASTRVHAMRRGQTLLHSDPSTSRIQAARGSTCSPFLSVSYYLLLTTYYSLLTTYYLLLTADYLLLTTYYLLLTTYYSLFTTYYLLLTTHYAPARPS